MFRIYRCYAVYKHFVTFVKSNALLLLTLRIRSKALSEGAGCPGDIRFAPTEAERRQCLPPANTVCLTASVVCRENPHIRLLIPAKYRRHSLWATVPNKDFSEPFHRLPFQNWIPNIEIRNRLFAHCKCKRHHILRQFRLLHPPHAVCPIHLQRFSHTSGRRKIAILKAFLYPSCQILLQPLKFILQ